MKSVKLYNIVPTDWRIKINFHSFVIFFISFQIIYFYLSGIKINSIVYYRTYRIINHVCK